MIDPFLDATAQAQLVRDRTASAQELVDSAISRIEALNDTLGAVTVTRFDAAREEAERMVADDRPFGGVPYVIKDHTLMTDGDAHTQGIAGLKEAGIVGDHDSYFVQSMREAGFVLVAKTNMPEMALGATTEPVAWGPARNPWDVTRSTGGSSGGSAAAVAAGLVPIAEGTDGGGSGRMPASHCGVVGLKPSRGRISSGPHVNAADNVHGMGTEALIARSVRDVAALLDVVSGHRSGDAYAAPAAERPFVTEVGAEIGRLRIGVLTADPAGAATVDPDCASAAERTAATLARSGHSVEAAFPEGLRTAQWLDGFMACAPVIIRRELDRLGELLGRPITENDVEPGTWGLAAMSEGITAAQYSAGVDSLRIYQRQVESWWEDDGWDLLITPTMPTPAPLLGQASPGGTSIAGQHVLSPDAFVVPFNVSGQPAISLPLTTAASGLPVGTQLVAAFGREDLLLRVAAQLELSEPWGERRPPVHA